MTVQGDPDEKLRHRIRRTEVTVQDFKADQQDGANKRNRG